MTKVHISLISVPVLSTEKLLSVDVALIGCGPHHVAVLSRDGEMYAWGRGDGGRLGLGHEEDWYLMQTSRLDCIRLTGYLRMMYKPLMLCGTSTDCHLIQVHYLCLSILTVSGGMAWH